VFQKQLTNSFCKHNSTKTWQFLCLLRNSRTR